MKRLALSSIILLLLTSSATAVCLSKKEARELWPKQHLYWYGKDRCWSNRRGVPKNLRLDPIIDKRSQANIKTALIAEAQAPKADKESTPDPWANAQPLKVRLIEFIPPAEAAPVALVEQAELQPPLPVSTTPPRKQLMETLAALGGGSLMALLTFVAFTRSKRYVASIFVWFYQGTTATGRKVLQACTRTRDKQPPIPEVNIRDFVGRANGTGHAPYPWEIYNSLADLSPDPIDDSAIACWSRSLRTKAPQAS